MFESKSLSLYPTEPGVYLMKDRAGTVLYVGKAKNLRVRLKQYFSAADERAMIPFLLSQVETIDTLVALTEKDALLLENNLIKRHRPKYNVLLKDDKTFVSLVLTEHRWPLLQLVRYKGKPKKGGTYFGPYTNAIAARQTYDLILRLFPLRQCSDGELASRTRPCLLHGMKKCVAPCVKYCTEEEYRSLVERAARLLKGQDKEVVKELKQKMEAASEALEFEKAAELLQLIRQIEHVTSVQHVDNPWGKDCDVIGLYREADAVMIALLLFREGKVVGSEHFSFHQIASDDEELVSSFLVQHYTRQTAWPREIFLPVPLREPEALEELLGEIAGKKVSIAHPKVGKKKDLVEMAFRNAKALFQREEDSRSLKEKRLLDLFETLQLVRFPRRIECIDTSNLSGSDPVASLICFVNGERDKSKMKLFKVKGASDDYAAMREVIRRHFLKQKERGDFCDLLIVDGGKGQLQVALEVFQELEIANVDVIALSKEGARHDKGLTQEKIHLPHRKDPILIDPKSAPLFLLQAIRDEAHRVAIEFQRKRRGKRLLSSELDTLEGIGPIKKRRLLLHFGSVKAIRNASAEALKEIKGLNTKDLETLKRWQENN